MGLFCDDVACTPSSTPWTSGLRSAASAPAADDCAAEEAELDSVVSDDGALMTGGGCRDTLRVMGAERILPIPTVPGGGSEGYNSCLTATLGSSA